MRFRVEGYLERLGTEHGVVAGAEDEFALGETDGGGEEDVVADSGEEGVEFGEGGRGEGW